MQYTVIADRILTLHDRVYKNNSDTYMWRLGFDIVNTLHEHGELSINPKYIAPTLFGDPIIIDYDNPYTVKLYKECKGV